MELAVQSDLGWHFVPTIGRQMFEFVVRVLIFSSDVHSCFLLFENAGAQFRRTIIKRLLLHWFPIGKLLKHKIWVEHVTNPRNHRNSVFRTLENHFSLRLKYQ